MLNVVEDGCKGQKGKVQGLDGLEVQRLGLYVVEDDWKG